MEVHDYLSMILSVTAAIMAAIAFGAFWGNKVVTKEELRSQLEDLKKSLESDFERRWDDFMLMMMEDESDE